MSKINAIETGTADPDAELLSRMGAACTALANGIASKCRYVTARERLCDRSGEFTEEQGGVLLDPDGKPQAMCHLRAELLTSSEKSVVTWQRD